MIKTMVALAALSLPMLSPIQAVADTPGCVSKAEFDRVDVGWRKKRVHRVFDTRGHRVASYTDRGTRYREREYPGCKHTPVTVLYRVDKDRRMRVVAKSRSGRSMYNCLFVVPFCIN